MFRGSIPALITPFRDDRIDETALVGLVNWHIAEGSHGLVAVGTTGESPTLSHEEHERCVEVVVRTAAGRIPVIAGAGSNSTAESVRLMEFARKVGADAAEVGLVAARRRSLGLCVTESNTRAVLLGVSFAPPVAAAACIWGLAPISWLKASEPT